MEEEKKVEEQEDVMTTGELAEHADDKVDALIKLLIKKGIISEQDFEQEYEALFEETTE